MAECISSDRQEIHDFAVNVSTDLSLFDGIVPCGLNDVRMTSLENKLGKAIPLAEFADRIVHHFSSVFGCEPTWVEPRELLAVTASVAKDRARVRAS